jgi:signal transduction histidine kinase
LFKYLSIKNRLFIISIVPLIILALISLITIVSQLASLMITVQRFAGDMRIESKKQELKNIVDIA